MATTYTTVVCEDSRTAADVPAARLRREGIDVVVDVQQEGSGAPTVGGDGQFAVRVPAEDADRARELLEQSR